MEKKKKREFNHPNINEHWNREMSELIDLKLIVVYRVPATGIRSPRIAYRQSLIRYEWLACGTSPVAQCQNGVDVKAIGFPLFSILEY